MESFQTSSAISKAFKLAMMTLKTPKLGYFGNEKYWNPKGYQLRIGTVSVESSMYDLFQCAMNNKEKRDKRIMRFMMIMNIYAEIGHKFGPEIDMMIEELHTLQIEKDTEIDNMEKMRKLKSEIDKKQEYRNGKLYFETGAWKFPITKEFHGFCTKEINKDGDVYDLMVKIAVISYANLMTMTENLSECEKELLSGSQLIFKGGAAIGKFLFKNKPFWNTLDEDLQHKIEESFIFGGDNDTSLYFANMKSVVKNHGENIVSESVISIADKLQNKVSMTCKEFDIEKHLEEHSKKVLAKKFNFGGSEFSFEQRKCQGFRLSYVDAYERDDFEIIDANVDGFEIISKPTVLCLSPYVEMDACQIFTTQSTVQFDTHGKLVKFELVRAKLGFVGRDNDNLVNSYSELLDISLEHPTSKSLFKKIWIPVDL